MQCNLCNKPTRCSCKGGGCNWCNATNQQIKVQNEILSFGASKEQVLAKKMDIWNYYNKIDSYTLYEYVVETIDKDKLDELVAEYKGNVVASSSFVPKKMEYLPNPQKFHQWLGLGKRSTCKFCGSVRFYAKENEECPQWVGNLNKEEKENE